MRIVVGHDNRDHWWWTATAEDGTVVATSSLHASRSDCLRSIAELKVEGPVASVTFDDPVTVLPFRRRGA